jgi:hypothetical protein
LVALVSGVALRLVLHQPAAVLVRQPPPIAVGTTSANPQPAMNPKPPIANPPPIHLEPPAIGLGKEPGQSPPGGLELAHAPKSHPCAPIELSDACISGSASKTDKQAILAALSEAEIKLCAGDFLNIVGRPSIAIKDFGGVRRSRHEPFVLALKGALRKNFFAGEAVVRCKR